MDEITVTAEQIKNLSDEFTTDLRVAAEKATTAGLPIEVASKILMGASIDCLLIHQQTTLALFASQLADKLKGQFNRAVNDASS